MTAKEAEARLLALADTATAEGMKRFFKFRHRLRVVPLGRRDLWAGQAAFWSTTRYPSGSSSSRFSWSAGTGPLCAGMEKFAVRWKTVSWLAWRAMSGMDWMPDEPVPMTATRWPVKSTPSCGQRLVK